MIYVSAASVLIRPSKLKLEIDVKARLVRLNDIEGNIVSVEQLSDATELEIGWESQLISYDELRISESNGKIRAILSLNSQILNLGFSCKVR